jgi:hypothetical protein
MVKVEPTDFPEIERRLLIEESILQLNKIVFFKVTEEYWNNNFPRKQHSIPKTKSLLLRGLVTEIEGDEFKAKLIGNNGFEKDGEEFIFHKYSLLSNQNYIRLDNLGKWE